MRQLLCLYTLGIVSPSGDGISRFFEATVPDSRDCLLPVLTTVYMYDKQSNDRHLNSCWF